MTSAALEPLPRPIDLVQSLAELGKQYDAAPQFPGESLRLLEDAGLHRRFAPPGAGGETFSTPTVCHRAMMDALCKVGRGDLSVGRLFEGHVNALLLFRWYGSPEQIGWLGGCLDRGVWFGVWASEPPPGVRLERAPMPRLEGIKHFASGAGGLDYALVTARDGTADRRIVIVPADDPDRADHSRWIVRGMRATVSGTYDLSGLMAGDDTLLGGLGDYDREPRFTAGAWRFCAVQLGGIEALIEETASQMRPAARADALLRHRLAGAHIAARNARFWTEEAARCAAEDTSEAILATRIARGVVEDAGLLAIETAARILGTRSAFDGERADKIARDLSLYLRQAGPDEAREEAAKEILARIYEVGAALP